MTRKDLNKNFALGILTSLLLVLFLGLFSPYLGGGFVGFSIPIGYFLLSYIIIGFGEEIVFRGYIQTRLTSNNGAATGIAVTTVLYAIYNIPMGFFCYSGNVPLSLTYGAWRVSSGLLYSYTFYKSQNIVPSSLVHTFLVWGGLLFRLYL
jgi:membrane protease YdiL (CAAX protease family)